MTSVFPCNSVSVVIPCFNAEKWIAAAIESVLAQRVAQLEVIVVNDGSTDGTQQILNAYREKIVLVNQSNAGVSSARREGVRVAKGQYIKFLDADDLMPAGALLALLDTAIKFPGSLILGRSIAFGMEGRAVDENMYNLPCRTAHEKAVPKEYLLTQATSTSLWFILRDVINDDGFFNRSICLGEEYAFCVQLIRHGGQVIFCDHLVSHIRVHDSPSRLSRSIVEADHLKQVDQISMAIAAINELVQVSANEPLSLMANLCWSRGRDCLRIGCPKAAEAYFLLAKTANSEARPVGSVVYRTVCALVGPVKAEWILSRVKSSLSTRGGK